MSTARLLPLAGIFAVLYLIALAAQTTSGGAYGVQAFAALLVALAVLAPPLLHRDQSDPRATVLVRWLGVLGGLAGTGVLVTPGMLPALDVVAAVAASCFGALLVTIALEVPDRARAYRRSRWLAVLVWIGALVPTAISLGASFGPVEVGPLGLVVLNDRALLAPPIFATACALPALLLHLARGRAGSDAAARATSGWLAATLAVGMVGMAAIASLRATVLAAPWLLLPAMPLVVLVVVLGHVRALDPSLARLAAPAVRRGLAVILLGAVALGAVMLARRLGVLAVPPGWSVVDLAIGGAAIAVVCGALAGPLAAACDRWLSPFDGQLLEALRVADDDLPGGSGIDGVARAVLRAMRRASGDAGSAPWLWTLSPDVEMGLDAAGEPHPTGRSMPDVLRAVFEDKLQGRSALPDEIFRHGVLLRWQIERDCVRRAELRPLATLLGSIDAAAVVPLVSEGMLEGALALPRGMRATPLTFEELEAFERLGRRICPLVTTLAAEARAMARAADATRYAEELEEAVELGAHKLESLEREVARLRTGRAMDEVDLERGAMVAYARAMRDLLQSVRAAAPLDSPVTLLAEPGCGAARVAQRLHEQGGRGVEPFVVVDCAAYPIERTEALLAGERIDADGVTREVPGWLETAGAGTLVLDAPSALSRPAQDALADALATREVRPVGGVGAVPVNARVIAMARSAPSVLAATGGLTPALAERLDALVLRVPTLAERGEDLGALVLLALDRASRVLGRPTIGIDEGAMDVLAGYAWPGNLPELARVIEHAVSLAGGQRVCASDVEAALGVGARAPLDIDVDVADGLGAETSTATPAEPPMAADAGASEGGTYEELERRILAEALLRASGNKSEAARSLGLKRTTFQDKLRRYGLLGAGELDPRAKRSEPPN